ncbi:MAG: sulfur carrier protein ThiS [Myxococcota bacterium]|nr:sulfur carrier protein ThiS [Myxococcota bacterium]MDW8361289.1 sulfur carrier protein ThiS [Myxococcales bacterium]
MRVTVNGESVELRGPMTVRDLLESLGLGATPVAVERNAEVVPRADHTRVWLRDGDCVEIVHFVGGG